MISLRLLLIDWTPMGGGTATGELKSTYFRDWPQSELLHIFALPKKSYGYCCDSNSGVLKSADDFLSICESFKPTVILYRPVAERIDFHEISEEIIVKLNIPYAVWLMDDWPDQIEKANPERYMEMDKSLRNTLNGSSKQFAISESMANAFRDRYKIEFSVLRNGVNIEDWEMLKKKRVGNELLIRYAGSLANHTTKSSIERIARAIDELAERVPIKFEIRTQKSWLLKEKENFKKYKSTTIEESSLDVLAYRKWLCEADIVLITYNYDPTTYRYLKYSFANKIPECLASGAAVLVHGPKELSSVAFLADSGVVEYVEEPEISAIVASLENLFENPKLRESLGDNARKLAFEMFSLEEQRKTLRSYLNIMANRKEALSDNYASDNREAGEVLFDIECAREELVQLDEIQFLSQLMSAATKKGLMVDVGAHYGGTLVPMANVGWRILGFEPDPNNLKKLLSNPYVQKPNVEIVRSAVGDREISEIPIYASDESSGVSGLTPFLESHSVVDMVPMVTLNSELSKRNITEVDFLKIDVEGHEMGVLRGLDFSEVKPRVIMLEYEDQKTEEHGYSVFDLAEFLKNKGYSVYVSEWWPVVRYGVRHSWRRLMSYPCQIPTDGWGNLIAFLDSPSNSEMDIILKRCLNYPKIEIPEPSKEKSIDEGNEIPIQLEVPKMETLITEPPSLIRWFLGYARRNLITIACGVLPIVAFVFMDYSGYSLEMNNSVLLITIIASYALMLNSEYSKFLHRRNQGVSGKELARTANSIISGVNKAVEQLDKHSSVAYQKIEALLSDLTTETNKQIALSDSKLNDGFKGMHSIMDFQSREVKSKFAELSKVYAKEKYDLTEQLCMDAKTRQDGFAKASLEMDQLREVLTLNKSDFNSSVEMLKSDFNSSVEMLKSDFAEVREKDNTKLKYLHEQSRTQIQKLNSLFVHMNGANSPSARVHMRHFTNAQMDRVKTYWSPHFGISLSRRNLAYIAHKICLIEDSIVGRLATDISTAMLRVIALRSLRKDKLNVLEIGTLFGAGAGILYQLGSDSAKISLTIIDPLDGYYGKGEVDLVTGMSINRKTLETNLKLMNVDKDDYSLVQKMSDDPKAVLEVSSKTYDYVLLDGDHSYEGVARDFKLYSPMVKVGGLLLFDDYDTTDWPDIKKFVDNNVLNNADWKLIGSEWRTAIFKRC